MHDKSRETRVKTDKRTNNRVRERRVSREWLTK